MCELCVNVWGGGFGGGVQWQQHNGNQLLLNTLTAQCCCHLSCGGLELEKGFQFFLWFFLLKCQLACLCCYTNYLFDFIFFFQIYIVCIFLYSWRLKILSSIKKLQQIYVDEIYIFFLVFWIWACLKTKKLLTLIKTNKHECETKHKKCCKARCKVLWLSLDFFKNSC